MPCIHYLQVISESCSVVSDSLRPHGLYSLWNFPGQNMEVGSLSLPQGIFPTQGSNPGLPHYRQILYQLSHRRSPRILEWVTYSYSNGSSRTSSWTRVSCIAGGFFTNWAIREALKIQVIVPLIFITTLLYNKYYQRSHFQRVEMQAQRGHNLAKSQNY